MPELIFPTPTPAYRFWRALRTVALNEVIKPITFAGTSHLFKATTGGVTGASEPAWNTGTGATTSSGSAIFTEAGLVRAGVRPSFYMKLQPDWDSITIRSTYEDRAVDTIRTAAAPPQRWLLKYNTKSEADVKMLDDFVDSVGLDTPFTFIEPRTVPWASGAAEGATFTGCYVESYNPSNDRKRVWLNAREIVLVKYAS